MKKLRHVSRFALLRISSNRILPIGLLLLSVLFLGVPSASALPTVNFDNCPPDWSNNPGALACEREGEQDIINNVYNNHYVACSADGTLFCCQGGGTVGPQDCQEITSRTLGTRSPLGDLQGAVQFGGVQVTTTVLSQIQQTLQHIQTEVDDLYNQQCQQQPVP